jgi:hypothetical protein
MQRANGTYRRRVLRLGHDLFDRLSPHPDILRLTLSLRRNRCVSLRISIGQAPASDLHLPADTNLDISVLASKLQWNAELRPFRRIPDNQVVHDVLELPQPILVWSTILRSVLCFAPP